MSAIQPHNSKSAQTWAAGGIKYDKVSQSITDAIAHCIKRIVPQPAEKILDIATGTGLGARLLAQYGAEVTGIDIGADLIDAATAIAKQQGSNIHFDVDDAESLSFADHSFDNVVSTFGVMFVSNPEAAAAEVARVCKPGGKMALATWLPDSTIADLFKVMKPYQPIAASGALRTSPFDWGTIEMIKALFDATFDLKFETGTTWLREADGASVWELFVQGYGPTKSLAALLEPQQLEALKKDFIGFHEGFKTALGISMPRDYMITLGIRK
ncbi:MAG: methyltransferase domain-containing protein [Agriterribacter sp.]